MAIFFLIFFLRFEHFLSITVNMDCVSITCIQIHGIESPVYQLAIF